MADFSLKAHDRLPVIQAALTQKDNLGQDQPIDLTTATGVKFVMRNKDTSTVKVNSPAAIIGSASLGIVQYQWGAGDTDVVGSYQAEWEITWPGPKKQTVPTASYHTIDILADLDNA